MKHFNALLTKSLFSTALLAMGAAAHAQVFEKVAEDAFLHTHRATPAIADINNDGLMDIYYGGEHYSGLDNVWQVDSWHPMGMVFINKGDGTFTGYASTTHEAGMNPDGTFKAFGLPPTIWNTTRWIDFNNDGNLDFISNGKSGDGLSINEGVNGGCYTLLYKNGGADAHYQFSIASNTGLAQGVNEFNDWAGNGSKSSISIGDYNHDGYSDIVMQIYHKYMDGDEEKGERKLALYKNNGDGTFTEQKVFEPIPYEKNPTPQGLFDMELVGDDVVATPKKIMRPLSHGAVIMGDLNGDGWLDIVATGWADGDNGGANMTIYKNNGDGTFSEVDLADKNFIGLQEAELIMTDINNDGNMDFVAFGTSNGGANKHADIYLNNGDGQFNFTRSSAVEGNGLYGAAEAQVRVCDLNHDGLVDIISTGWSDTNGVNNWGVRVLFQNADGSFALKDKGALPDLFYNGGFELGHLTSKTSVDLFATGEYSGTAANLFKNTEEADAATPAEPTNVAASYANGQLTITWAGNENNLGTAYNVYVRNKATGWISMILPADIETGALKTIQDMQTALRSEDPTQMSYSITIPDADYEVGVSAVNPDAVCSKFAKADHVSTGIGHVNDNPSYIKAHAVNGGILAEGEGHVAVAIYNAAGQLVAEGVSNKIIAVKGTGLYLIKTGNKTTKVFVR